MGDTKFVHNARFVGRKPVDGPLNDFRLSEVVAVFQSEKKANEHDEMRCNVEFSDRNLLVTYIKKDEGFESDTESANSVEHKEEKSSSATDEKIIKDHVFQFSGDDSYSSNSSGSDSETSDHNKSSSTASSASASPTAELSRYKFDHLETYSIGDVLICHTDKVFKNCVIWVIRKSGGLEALVFECLTEENARQLYRKFHETSKRSKLERHRRRKSDGGSIVTRASGHEFSNVVTATTTKSTANENVTINNIDTSVIEKAVANSNKKWNLVQHTDRNGVTHIEVESTNLQEHLVNNRGGSVDETRNLVSLGPRGNRPMTRNALKGGDRSKFAKELESILSTEIKRRDGDLSSMPAARGQGDSSETTHAGHEGGPTIVYPRLSRPPPGESLSLRQRAPALLLRKLDEFEEKAHKIWAKAEAEEENRKVWKKESSSVIGISSPMSRGPQLDTPISTPTTNQKNIKENSREQKSSRTREDNFPSSNATKCKQKGGGGGDVVRSKDEPPSGRILVPTKTGKEPPKKLYPKESPALYAGRFLQMAPMQGINGQPHSLPIYPVQWGMGRTMGYMDPAAQLDISQSIWRVAPGPSAVREERSRSRERGRGGSDEQRRRAQSKSPARRGSGHQRYMENVPSLAPDISGLGRMFRELGAGMKAKMSRPKTPLNASTDVTDLPSPSKSNLKKREETPNGKDADKKVHFNKFATVQMMA